MAQDTDNLFLLRPYDPAVVQSRVALDADSYYFVNANTIYTLRTTFYYAIPNQRHLFGLSVPFVHAIFNGNYGGYENTTGIGDIRFNYLGVPYLKKTPLGLEKLSFRLDVSSPTGNADLGRGAGAWLYKPALIAGIQPAVNVNLFPEVSFQFSGKEVNSQGGTDGLPDPEDPEDDAKLELLSFVLPVSFVMPAWDGYLTLNPQYAYTFVEKTYFLFLQMDVGKMMGGRSSATLQVQQFIAGQPRLNTSVRVRFNFFIGAPR
jgi:hypothetical protein